MANFSIMILFLNIIFFITNGGIQMTDKKFYITTPIYYPSDYLHIGHWQQILWQDTKK